MRYLFVLLFFISSFVYSQDINNKSVKTSFKVSGVCEMCKLRIEKGAIKIKGVKYASWDVNSNKLSIIYNSNKINIDNIHKNIAKFGHDTEKYKATDKVYQSLPDCCYYKTLSIH